jgi:hypothetical protein
MLIRGDEGVDIDIREESGCEMGDGSEKNCEAGRVLRCVLWGSTHAIDYETNEAREK